MASLGKIIEDDRHPLWLIDAIILSSVVYSKNPQEELEVMNREYGLPPSAQYEFVSEEELNAAGFEGCRQTLLVVRSLTGGHVIAAFRGTFDVSDALTDLNLMHRTLSLGPGAAHAGFLDRAKSIPLDYFRRLLVRGDNLVLTGHSLGGAVASLLALRLLEVTGRWCHEQLQCYTLGSPFFADYRLAMHINTQYKHHFVHIVSRDDIVPKVMPVAYIIYSIWAGLEAGPLQDLVHISNIALLAAQFLMKGKTYKVRLFTVCTQAVAWLPGLLRMVLHRALALALSYQSGCGYAFAGHMVLLDPNTSALEYVDQDCWTVKHHLDFHLNTVSFDVMKGHSLLSYINHVFAVQSAEASEACASQASFDDPTTIEEEEEKSPKVEICTATLNMKWFKKKNRDDKKESTGHILEMRTNKKRIIHHHQKKKKAPLRLFRSKVACLIFARRIQEAAPKTFMEKQRKRRPLLRFLVISIGRLSRFAHQFDSLFIFSSVLYVAVQLHKLCRCKMC